MRGQEAKKPSVQTTNGYGFKIGQCTSDATIHSITGRQKREALDQELLILDIFSVVEMLLLKLILVAFLFPPKVLSADEEFLYTAFATYPKTNATLVYNDLMYYENKSKKVFTYYANDTSVDYRSYTWFNACYREFYATNSFFVVFWQFKEERICVCEALGFRTRPGPLRYPVENLMRVEWIGTRCEANNTNTSG
ncbi:unnamed protein product [Caenorhabditis nigoni]